MTQSNKDESISEYFFRVVTTPIHGSNRTVTCDNWFTSIPLLQKMKRNEFKLSITGTIRKNKREIPAEMKLADKNPPHTKFCFADNMTLLTYTPKKNKIVLVVSNYINSTKIVDGKPAIILHYNKTKGGTDCFDQLCHSRTTARKTNRWPMRIFLGILDQAAVNARILLACRIQMLNKKREIEVGNCMKQLYLYLVTPHLKERLSNVCLRTSIRVGINSILGVNEPAPNELREVLVLEKRTRCALCNRDKDRKTKEACPSCLRPMCMEHRTPLCQECANME